MFPGGEGKKYEGKEITSQKSNTPRKNLRPSIAHK